jgi:hypothetical protein
MAIRPNTTILVTLLRRSKIAVDIAYLPRAENLRVKKEELMLVALIKTWFSGVEL